MIRGIALAAALVCCTPSFADDGLNLDLPPAKKGDKATPHVRVETATGHGSGIYIGNGKILTAAHVIDGNKGDKDIRLVSEAGGILFAKLMWQSPGIDVALLKLTYQGVDATSTLRKVPLACRDGVPGEEVTVVGNPSDIKFAIARGYIAAARQDLSGGEFKDVVIASLNVFGGNSGAGVLDKNGQVLGLVHASLRGTQYTLITSGKRLCEVLE